MLVGFVQNFLSVNDYGTFVTPKMAKIKINTNTKENSVVWNTGFACTTYSAQFVVNYNIIVVPTENTKIGLPS